MLLYALLHLTGVRAANEGRSFERTHRLARGNQALPPARQQNSRPSGIAHHHRRRNHHGTAGPGRGQQRGHGDCQQMAGGEFQSSRIRDLSTSTSTPSAATATHGRRSQRSRVVGRTSQAFESVLDLRQQPRHPRRSCGLVVQRRCGQPLPGLWLEHYAVSDANDLDALAKAYGTFLKTRTRPTLIIVDSHIGYGSPHKQDTNEAHGEG
jgi:transketolase